MTRERRPAGWIALFVIVICATASAQSPPPIQGITTTLPDLTLAETVTQLFRPAGAPNVGAALGLATRLEIATAPLGVSSGGEFLIKLDPSTGLQVRTASTFGPSFAERALTSGEGTVTVGVHFVLSTFDRLGSQAFDGLQLRSVTAPLPKDGRLGVANVAASANTAVITGRVGVTNDFDVAVVVPVVKVKVNGTTSVRNGNGDMILFAEGRNAGSGLGDIAGIAKWRFHRFGSGPPDPGGLALMATIHLPTGDVDNLRGLGTTRTMLSFIFSSGKGKFRPHANVGFERSQGVSIPSDYAPGSTVVARHRYEYAAGLDRRPRRS